MKTFTVAVCSLPALLSLSVFAAPSYEPFQHQQQQHSLRIAHPSGHTSRWRSFSDYIFKSLFTSCNDQSEPSARPVSKPDRPFSSNIRARYGEHLVLRFNISTSEEAASLSEAADTLLLDVWEFSHDWVDIRLAKKRVPTLLGLLPPSLRTAHMPLMREQDLVQAIHNTYPAPRGQVSPQRHQPATPAMGSANNRGFGPSLQQATGADTNIFFSDYQPLSVIEPWLRLLASLFTTHVRHISIGLSYEGRPIPAVRVGVHPTNNEDPKREKRKTILVTGGAHAREWIGTATVNYIAYSLITGYGKLQSITKLLQDFDFVFIPTLNPDGYVYTWETDRLWRKNRQRTNFGFCPGIDLDHAFGFAWEPSGTPCSESYAGESPFEAVEAKRLADWARNETDNNNVEFVAFLDLHSYSQEILYPYSYSCRATPPGLENLEELAAGLSKAIRISYGHNYEILPACEGNVMPNVNRKERLRPRIEASGGSLLDFFYGSLEVRYSYQLKLRDRGTYGFLLPKENIVPTGKEVLNAVLYLAAFLGEMYTEDAVEVRLTKPVLEEDVAAQAVYKEVDEHRSAPVADILDEVEVENVPAWVQGHADSKSEPELDVEDVQWDLKRR